MVTLRLNSSKNERKNSVEQIIWVTAILMMKYIGIMTKEITDIMILPPTS